MLYRILRIITRLGLLGYYRKIYMHKDIDIPKDRPVILAANHPNAFTEPLLMACFSGRELHFITRSDVFHPMLMWFFKGTHQIPIFRFVDKGGYKNLKNNKDTFSRCYDVLSKNGAILIFSEGSTRLGKTVRPLQKGTAKMAFGLVDSNPDLDPVIVPVGFTYSKPNHWNGDVMINIGEAIEIKKYINKDLHVNENIKAINASIKRQLDVLAINIVEDDNEEFQEGISNVHRRSMDQSIGTLKDVKGPFDAELLWTQKMNNGNEVKGQRKAWIQYRDLLLKKNIDFKDFVLGDFTYTKFLFLIAGLPFAVVGLAACSLTLLMTSFFVKSKIKNLIFSSGVKIGMGTFSSFILAIIFTIILIFNFGWIGIFGLPIIVLLMLCGIKWLSLFKSAQAHAKYLLLNKSEKEILTNAHAVLKQDY